MGAADTTGTAGTSSLEADPPAAETSRPLRRDAERNRRRILAAARVLFAKHGVDVGLEDVARRAGVGVGTVYRRFPDRRALIDELLEEKVAAIEALAVEGLADDDPWRGFTGFLERSQELHAADRALTDALLAPRCEGERIAAARARIDPLVAELVARARACGALRPDFTPGDYPLLVEMIAAVTRAAGDRDPDLWRRFTRLLIDGLATSRPAPSDLGAGALAPDEPLRRAASPSAARTRRR
jgi:AcrR family transcriptional regulator